MSNSYKFLSKLNFIENDSICKLNYRRISMGLGGKIICPPHLAFGKYLKRSGHTILRYVKYL
jgi:hypothetical protein